MNKPSTLDLNRRSFLKLALATSAGAIASTPSLQIFAKGKDVSGLSQPVKVGYLPITDATPLLIAHANGLFEAEGLKAEKPTLFRSWAQISEAFIAGQVNVVHLLSPVTIWLRYGKKFPAKIVAWNHTNGSAITSLPEIKSVSDFAGKTVGIPFWYSIHNIVLQQLLANAGLKVDAGTTGKIAEDAVRLSVLPPPDMVAALANKSIAGYTVAEPFNAAAEKLNIGRILRFTGDVWRDHACCVVLMKEEDIAQNREWSQRVVNAVVKAQQWILPNRTETAKILSKESGRGYTPHTEAALDRVLNDREVEQYVKSGAIVHPEWQEPRIGFQPYPFPSYTEELVRILQKTKVEGDNAFLSSLDPAFVANDLVDESLIRTALGEVGGPATFGIESFTRSEEIVV